MQPKELVRPSFGLTLLETRAVGELYLYAWSYPFLHLAPRGDGHPVLVLPGFLASGSSTFPMRHILKRLGYKGHRWKLGRNMGPTQVDLDDVLTRLYELRERYDSKVSLIGWSLGGIYARAMGWIATDAVRQVITLGSPFRRHDKTSAAWLYNSLNGHYAEHVAPELMDLVERPPPVPSTSIYTRGDGVVPWQCSLDRQGPTTENIRVYGSHCGLGHNPSALWAILDRLAQGADEWAPFERGLCRMFVYPKADDVHDFPIMRLV